LRRNPQRVDGISENPQIEIVQLEAKLPSAIDSEAKSKECDFVIYAQASHKKGGGGGMFGSWREVSPVRQSRTSVTAALPEQSPARRLQPCLYGGRRGEQHQIKRRNNARRKS
jgi:hypothetical protein